MSREIGPYPYLPGSTLKVAFIDERGYVWQTTTSTWIDLAGAAVANCLVAMSEVASGIYYLDLPFAQASRYTFIVYNAATAPASFYDTATRIGGDVYDASVYSRNSGNVTVGAYAAGQDPASLVWSALLTGYTVSGSFGKLLQAQLDVATSTRLAASGYTAPPTDAAIQGDVQTAMTAQGYTVARAGYLDVLNGLVAAIWGYAGRTLATFGDSTGISTLLGRLTLLRAGYLDNLTNLDAPVSSRNAIAPDNASVAAIKAKTDNLPSQPAAKSDVQLTVNPTPVTVNPTPVSGGFLDADRTRLAQTATGTNVTDARSALEAAIDSIDSIDTVGTVTLPIPPPPGYGPGAYTVDESGAPQIGPFKVVRGTTAQIDIPVPLDLSAAVEIWTTGKTSALPKVPDADAAFQVRKTVGAVVLGGAPATSGTLASVEVLDATRVCLTLSAAGCALLPVGEPYCDVKYKLSDGVERIACSYRLTILSTPTQAT